MLVLASVLNPTSRHKILAFASDKSEITPAVPSINNGHYLAVLPFAAKGDPKVLGSIADGLDGLSLLNYLLSKI